MAAFTTGQPIVTDTPNVQVEASAGLAPGKHRFQLVVTDDSGNQSKPTEVEVIVRDNAAPTAVLDAPRAVEAGKAFELNGRRSLDLAPGKIVSYSWTLLI